MKIFYVGLQRSGTKSFGEFFRRNGYSVCSWPELEKNRWGRLVFQGKLLDVLNSDEFAGYDVFEDGPFYRHEFVKFLYHYVENSKFVFFHRPASDWYKSMVTHSNGMTLGDISFHCDFYDRLDDLQFFREEIDSNLHKLPLIGMHEHYVRQYEKHKIRIRQIFKDAPRTRFFEAPLYCADKWKNMACQFELKFDHLDDVHTHKSPRAVRDILKKHGLLRG